MIRKAKRDLTLDGETRYKSLQERVGKEYLKIGNCGRNWEGPMFTNGLIRADDDDDDDDDDDIYVYISQTSLSSLYVLMVDSNSLNGFVQYK